MCLQTIRHPSVFLTPPVSLL